MENIIGEVLSLNRLDKDGYRYIKSECTRDHRRFTVILRLPLSDLGNGESVWETVEEIHRSPMYDQDTFEDMIWDFCADHVNDDDWDGEWPEIDKDGIIYDEINNRWVASCKFASDPQWYTLVGDEYGNVTLYS